MTDRYFDEDLNDISAYLDESFDNKSIFVTGATGLVGSIIVKALVRHNKNTNANIQVYALVRNEQKVRKIFSRDEIESINFVYANIEEKLVIDNEINLIIHCASPTVSKYFMTNPVETIKTSIDGTINVLELALKKKTESVVYLSSMEMYGIPYPFQKTSSETDLGFIDPLNIRSCYSQGKRMCETICASYFSEYDVPVKIGRLAQTFGAGVSIDDNRVFAQFAKCIINEKDFVLHTKGESWGNYCYSSDAIRAIFLLLNKGVSGEAYNIANESTNITIADMANLVNDNFSTTNTKIIFDIPKGQNVYGYAPEVHLKLNSQKIQGLGWLPKYDLVQMYERLIESFRSQLEEE